MDSKIFKQYVWLVDSIRKHPNGVSYDMLNEMWKRNHRLNPFQLDLSKRTLANWREKAEDFFNISIKCPRSTNRYFIENPERLEGNNLEAWLLSCISISEIAQGNENLSERILLENIPSGKMYLKPIIEAMRENHIIRISYKPFHEDEQELLLSPYCVKLYQRRWYMLAKRIDNNVLRCYSLDRIIKTEETTDTFVIPEDFNARLFFKDYYGCVVHTDVKPQIIKIMVDSAQCDYIRTLPIHESQHEIETQEDYSIFELYLAPTYDFILALLSQGDFVKLIEPIELSQQFGAYVANMAALYE